MFLICFVKVARARLGSEPGIFWLCLFSHSSLYRWATAAPKNVLNVMCSCLWLCSYLQFTYIGTVKNMNGVCSLLTCVFLNEIVMSTNWIYYLTKSHLFMKEVVQKKMSVTVTRYISQHFWQNITNITTILPLQNPQTLNEIHLWQIK
jgi:hypothetical protein